MRRGRGWNLTRLINEGLSPLLRGWGNDFHMAEVKETFEVVDKWRRRNLQVVLWRHWKKRVARFRNLMRLGLDRDRGLAKLRERQGPVVECRDIPYERCPS